MKILVTGGAGFIGSCFIRLLLKEDPKISIMNLDALTYAGSKDSLKEIQNISRYEFVHGDICDKSLVSKILAHSSFDAIINFAAESHVDRSIVEPEQFVKTNVMGTQVLLHLAREHHIEKFVQVSTDEVYGSLGEDGIFTEENSLDPSSPYSASKAGGDLLCLSYFKTYDFPVMITRSANNYGPFQFPEKLIPVLVGKALKNQKLPLYGDGRNVRTWLHVRDNCQAIRLVLERGGAGRVYNISGGQECRNIDIAKTILKTLGKSEDLIEFVEDRPGHDWRYALEDQRIRKELEWQPQISFEKGLVETVRWYEKNQDWVEKVLKNYS